MLADQHLRRIFLWPIGRTPSADSNPVHLLVSFKLDTFPSQKSPSLTCVKKRCQQQSKEVNTTLGRRNDRRRNQIQVNSAAKQEIQQSRFNRCLSIGAFEHRCIRSLVEGPMPPVGLFLLDANWNQVKIP